jgi:hypothetical protein
MGMPYSTHSKEKNLITILVKEAEGKKPLEKPKNRWKLIIKPNLQEARFRKKEFEYETNCTVINRLLACL